MLHGQPASTDILENTNTSISLSIVSKHLFHYNGGFVQLYYKRLEPSLGDAEASRYSWTLFVCITESLNTFYRTYIAFKFQLWWQPDQRSVICLVDVQHNWHWPCTVCSSREAWLLKNLRLVQKWRCATRPGENGDDNAFKKWLLSGALSITPVWILLTTLVSSRADSRNQSVTKTFLKKRCADQRG